MASGATAGPDPGETHHALALLGLSPGADADDVRAAYRAAALANHPDRPAAPGDAHERMAELNRAYDLLSRPGVLADVAASTSAPRRVPGPAHGAAAGPANGPKPPAAEGHAPWAEPIAVSLDEEGTLLVEASHEETFELLHEAAHQLGDVTYLDADAGLLQIIVHHEQGPWCYVTFSLQGRAAGTEVFATIEPLTATDTTGARSADLPPVELGALLTVIAEELARCAS